MKNTTSEMSLHRWIFHQFPTLIKVQKKTQSKLTNQLPRIVLRERFLTTEDVQNARWSRHANIIEP